MLRPWTSLHLRIAYSHSFVMDGNFTAVHQHQDSAHTDIKLSHGEFYMTEPHQYKAHLTIAKEIKEVCYLIYHSTFLLIQQ